MPRGLRRNFTVPIAFSFLQIFAIQFYGECWSGDISEVDYDRWGVADKSRCPFGVGGPNVNAVYKILPSL